jgi:hypothetical protein
MPGCFCPGESAEQAPSSPSSPDPATVSLPWSASPQAATTLRGFGAPYQDRPDAKVAKLRKVNGSDWCNGVIRTLPARGSRRRPTSFAGSVRRRAGPGPSPKRPEEPRALAEASGGASCPGRSVRRSLVPWPGTRTISHACHSCWLCMPRTLRRLVCPVLGMRGACKDVDHERKGGLSRKATASQLSVM